MFNANTLLIGSGGTLSYGMLGSLAHLDACQHLAHVNRFVGVSAGSILCLMLCAGIKVKTIVQIFFETDFSTLQSISPLTLVASYGLDSGNRLMAKIASVFGESGLSHRITFSQLRGITKRELAVGVTDIIEKRFVLMSADSHPDVEVLSAIRASIAIPILFSPEEINGKMYVDGAVMSGFPIGLSLDTWPDSRVIGIRASQLGRNRKIEGLMDYVSTLFACVGSNSHWDAQLHTKDKGEVFRDISVKLDATSFLSSPSKELKGKMFEIGYNASREVFPEVPPEPDPLD